MTLTYKVIDIEKYPKFTDSGNKIYVYRITFKILPINKEDFIEVTESEYLQGLWKERIQEILNQYEELFGVSK